MQYQSTRNSEVRFSASEIILKGISDEGGLFIPDEIPNIKNEFSELATLDYCGLAERILSLYLTDFTPPEIHSCVAKAYDSGKFDGEQPVTVRDLENGKAPVSMLELWHGPTCAFKDIALQILPYFLSISLEKQAPGKKAVILVATSGDTGKAALEGFKDVPNTEIIVFYPEYGVSPMQKKQMSTQEGSNVFVCAVTGNFDDTQTGIKKIFTDYGMKARLKKENLFFSSANSINWGRLLPQIVYYLYSYFELYRSGKIKSLDDKINIVVPTGNFGNILAAYFAYKMGMPVNKFICASNENKVLTDFIRTGIYDRRRDFYATASPSMDILISSNLERLLYLLGREDGEKLKNWMRELSDKGMYEIDAGTKEKLSSLFYGNYCDDKETGEVIRKIYEERNYLCDTHTAVAIGVYEKYQEETGDSTPTVIASTASPYKFVSHVLRAIKKPEKTDEFDMIAELEAATGTTAQPQLKELKSRKNRFSTVIAKEEMPMFVSVQIEEWKGRR